MSSGLYNLGTLLLLVGVVYIGHLAGIPGRWVIVTAFLLLVTGIMAAVSTMRQRDFL